MTTGESEQATTGIYAEQTLLGAILCNGSAWDIVADKLSEHNFTAEAHKRIYRGMISLAHKFKPIDIITLNDELISLNDEVDFSYLGEIALHSRGLTNLESYIDIIQKQSVLQQVRSAADKINDLAFDVTLSPLELMAKAESEVYNLSVKNNKNTKTKSITDAISLLLDKLDEKEPDYLPTGFTYLDNLMSGGMRAGEFIIIAGRPAMGKTTLGINIAENVALTGKKALIFSMEMMTVELTQRIIASVAKIEHFKLRQNELNEADWTKLGEAVRALKENNIYINDATRLKPMELRSIARRTIRESENKIALIVIDYIQLMRSDKNYNNRVDEMSEVSGQLKALAKELQIPIIGLAQLNRMSANRAGDNKRPTMSELRDSGSLEQDADLVALIYRDEYYNKDSADKGIAEIIVDKNRNGQTGILKLLFRGNMSRFENYREYTL